MSINDSHCDIQNVEDAIDSLKEKFNRKVSNANSLTLERPMSVESAEMFFNGNKEKENNCDKLNSIELYYKEREVNIIENESRNENETNSNKSYLTLKENIKKILMNLHRAYQMNKMNQMFYIKKYDELSNKQNLIEETIDKIKKVSKSKQKKHVKYLRYIPLSKIYYYSPKKTHFYYIFMDIVVKSRKKPILGNENKNFQFTPRTKENKSKKRKNIKDQYSQDENIHHHTEENIKNNIMNKNLHNRFKFKPDEDEILKKLILYSGGEYMNWYQIACDFNDFIMTILKDSRKEINYKQRTPLELYARSLELSDFYIYKKWNTNEDLILKKSILYYGPKNWQQISYCLDGRNNSQCFHRWMKGINPKIKRSKWSFEEDLTLGIALRIYGNKKWSKIANHLEGRTDIQCRERFCNILDPSLEEVEWTSLEDIKLLMLYDKMKNKWSKIAKEFGNRTDNTCWRRWKYLESIRKSHGIYPHYMTGLSRFNVSSSPNLSRMLSGNEGGIIESNSNLLNDGSLDDNIEMTDKKKFNRECDNRYKFKESNSNKLGFIYDEAYGHISATNISKKKNKKKNIFLVKKMTPKETIETSL